MAISSFGVNYTGLVDQKIGDVYETLTVIEGAVPELKHISANLVALYDVSQNIEAIIALGTASPADLVSFQTILDQIQSVLNQINNGTFSASVAQVEVDRVAAQAAAVVASAASTSASSSASAAAASATSAVVNVESVSQDVVSDWVIREFNNISSLTGSTEIGLGYYSVTRGYNGQPEKFKIVAAATYIANAATVINLAGIAGQAVSTRRKFNTKNEFFADTRAASFFATNPAVDAENTLFSVAGLGEFYMALSGAVDADVLTSGGVKTYSTSSNVKTFGAKGDGVTDDTAAFLKALSRGSIYIPATANYYLVSDDLPLVNGARVTGDGYLSQVRQTVQGKNGFVMAHDSILEKVRVKMPVGNNLDLTKQNCAYIDGKKNVKVRDNWFELADIAVSGVQARGACAQITITGNIIYGGLWSSGAGPNASAADILFYNSVLAGRIVIHGNYCLSNNSQGMFIDALGANAEVVVTDNVCVTLDTTTCTQGGTWSEAATGGTRRHGILFGYNANSVNGPRSIITGNLCRNTRWTGIYLQGVSEGRLVSGNVCTDNGYELGNSLSGGIYVIQAGNEIIEGNFISGFKNTLVAVGGITINASTQATVPSKISDNFIVGSAGTSIALGTNTALTDITDNVIVGSVGNDIYAVPANVAGNGGYHIARNRIFRTSGSDVQSIRVVSASLSSKVTRIIGNRIYGFNNSNNVVGNAGIYLTGASSAFQIKDNLVENFYHGLYFASYQTTNRNAQISQNDLVDCSVGISMGAVSNLFTVPVVDNRFVGMLVSEIGGALGGGLVARNCTREGTRLAAHTFNAAPTVGDWAIGDRAMFTTPIAAGNIGAVCVTAGAPGTWKTFGAIAA